VGQGVPDLLVGLRGKTYLMEIKDGQKPPSDQKLTPDQLEWINAWRRSLELKTGGPTPPWDD
jgi:hypothetical protein